MPSRKPVTFKLEHFRAVEKIPSAASLLREHGDLLHGREYFMREQLPVKVLGNYRDLSRSTGKIPSQGAHVLLEESRKEDENHLKALKKLDSRNSDSWAKPLQDRVDSLVIRNKLIGLTGSEMEELKRIRDFLESRKN